MQQLIFFAVSAPGLELLLAQELQQLNIAGSVVPGGVEFQGSRRNLYRANLHLRTASRLLVRLGEFYAVAFSELRKKAGRLPWENFLVPGQPVAIRATCHKSKLYHSDAVAERVAGAISDRLGWESLRHKGDDEAESNPAQLIIVRLVRDKCVISLDSSGALLHQRGYRLATAKAPLRETLAAGMLLASGWDTTSPLLEPFCGSGTIAIEAALLAKNLAPGRGRRFAFMQWPDFDATLWQTLTTEAERRTKAAPPILASDRDAGAIDSARTNADRAGVGDAIEFSCRAISAIESPAGLGWVVTNPPYGVRLSHGRDLRNLYASFAKILRAKCLGWRVAILVSDLQLLRDLNLEYDEALPLVNGGMKVKLARGKVIDS
jgi:putative N6-adenine-specific DNA methylase